MRAWKRIEGGIRKYHAWGESEVYMSEIEDCFTREELGQVIRDLSSLPLDSLTEEEKKLLSKCKEKRARA